MGDHYNFDIDVDITPFLPGEESDELDQVLLSDTWYQLARPQEHRSYLMQAKADQLFKNAMLHSQWQASRRRKLDRRHALRAPLLTRVHVDGFSHMTSTDISLSGLRCSGVPNAPLMELEFKLPGMPFPIDVRAEVVEYKEANVIPLVGMRFVGLQGPYREQIARYVNYRASQTTARAA